MKVDFFPFISLGGIARPMLCVRLSSLDTGKSTVSILATIDTGADVCIFPLGVLESLGYTLTGSEEAMPIAAAAGTTKGYSQEVMLEILEMSGDSPGKVLYRIPKVIVYFVMNNKQFILGTRDFLDRFVITLDYKRQSFSLAPQEGKPSRNE